VVIDIRKWKL